MGCWGSRLVIIPEKLTGRAKERTQRWSSVFPKRDSQGRSPLNSPSGPDVHPRETDTGMDHLRHLLGDLLK